MSERSATAGTLATLRRGLALSPELRKGLAGTLAMAVLATAGRAALPIAIQQGIDRGLRAPGGPDGRVVAIVVALTTGVLVLTATTSYVMMRRLFTATETALARVRERTFRHIHDLSMLHQQSERRGTLTSRVTSDIDQISQFLQYGGLTLVVSAGQILITSVVMAVYSWPLALVVWAAFLPMIIVVRLFQRRLAVAFAEVRARVGALLGSIAESVVGAEVIRAYGVADRTAERIDASIESYRSAQVRAQRMAISSFSMAEFAAGLATAAVVVVGVLLGVGGRMTVGEITAFLFLVALFVQPVQIATEVLNEAQNAISGWGRVLEVLDTQPDVADPGEDGLDLPHGPIDVRFSAVGFRYTDDGPEALSDIDVAIEAKTRIAVVGETGSGKTTFAKLLTRLMDPGRGSIELSGVPLPRVRFAALRRRVVLVPQDGFLFDDTVAANVRFAKPSCDDAELERAFGELGLSDWVDGLPDGLATSVGERGEALSVGERQLVALVRAYVADPDLLVLDEATSAVDPATEVRLQRALDAVTRGRTTVAIAHRLSTAESADEVLVFDRGRLVQRGPHAALVGEAGSVYARLHAAWLDQTRSAAPLPRRS